MIAAAVACTMIWVQVVATPASESSEIEVVSTESQVGYEALMAGDNARAIAEISSNASLAQDDPARLLNLGIAYARSGDEGQARQLFKAALASRNQMELETSQGDWIYSRALAREALQMLDDGSIRTARMAIR
ncbi:hypothetical protein G6N82_04420 [Altererythrobacter sp. BO-6]|uniref:hypothetical protein n=1 Tax=Altererythrobacter sp. BO-6 TaxID=2604537 RepID=UPI0013E1C2BF|nr:hypothetical protein [Altererythrobacter sp. BO-6]QIG53494.1 hypothetical protein G6N82_04420 [Altererythrobacter sp. BO-6]